MSIESQPKSIRPWMIGASVALVAVAGLVLYPLSQKLANTPETVASATAEPIGPFPDFAFVSHLGDPVSRESLDGRVAVIGFFFTSCTGICPGLTSAMKRLDDAFSGSDEVRLLQVSVDPATDTVERLKEFAQSAGCDGNRWLIVRGGEGEAMQFARDGLSLGTTEVPGDILHSDRFVLVDQAGLIRGYYRPLDPEEFERLVTDMRALIARTPAN